MFEKLKAVFSRNKEPTKEEFNFAVNDVNKIGDHYSYAVEGVDRKDAQRRLVEYFFGISGEVGSAERVKSTHATIVFPAHCYVRAVNNNIFSGQDADKFARLISGGEATQDDFKWLDKFMEENNIKKRS